MAIVKPYLRKNIGFEIYILLAHVSLWKVTQPLWRSFHQANALSLMVMLRKERCSGIVIPSPSSFFRYIDLL